MMIKFLAICSVFFLISNNSFANFKKFAEVGVREIPPKQDESDFNYDGLKEPGPDELQIEIDSSLPLVKRAMKYAADYAIEYSRLFYNEGFRNKSDYNQKLFELGGDRFEKEYDKPREQYVGYVWAGGAEHILASSDCTHFSWAVWKHAIEEVLGVGNHKLPYLPTTFMYDLVVAHEQSNGDRDQAYENYKARLVHKMAALNEVLRRNGEDPLPADWDKTQWSNFFYYNVLPSYADARRGDTILQIKTGDQYLERGHAYIHLEATGPKSGIGSQGHKVGYAYNKPSTVPKTYALRLNFKHVLK